MNEHIIVAINMRRYGGSFAQRVGEALSHADCENTQKIKDTWPELWEKYLHFAPCDDEAKTIPTSCSEFCDGYRAQDNCFELIKSNKCPRFVVRV